MKYDEIITPQWCDYPDPNHGAMGCFSLILGYITSRKYCENCDCYNNCAENPEHEKAVVQNQALVKEACNE